MRSLEPDSDLATGHCAISRAFDHDPHRREDCCVPSTWEEENDLPPDPEDGPSYYHRQWEAKHPVIQR